MNTESLTPPEKAPRPDAEGAKSMVKEKRTLPEDVIVIVDVDGYQELSQTGAGRKTGVSPFQIDRLQTCHHASSQPGRLRAWLAGTTDIQISG